jgi:hypothetical protein
VNWSPGDQVTPERQKKRQPQKEAALMNGLKVERGEIDGEKVDRERLHYRAGKKRGRYFFITTLACRHPAGSANSMINLYINGITPACRQAKLSNQSAEEHGDGQKKGSYPVTRWEPGNPFKVRFSFPVD